jgi:hypothetical protein
MATDRLLPELWPLHRIAKELGKSTHVLVDASTRGEFPSLVRFGAVWHVRADLMREWCDRQHAPAALTPGQIDQIRQAAQGEEAPPPSRRPRQPRARNAASS